MVVGVFFAVLGVTSSANRLCRTRSRSSDGVVGFVFLCFATRSLTFMPMLRFGSSPFGIPVVSEFFAVLGMADFADVFLAAHGCRSARTIFGFRRNGVTTLIFFRVRSVAV